MSDKSTSWSAVVAVVLKEIRLEQGISQALMAEWLSKAPSTVNKIESCAVPITIEIMVRYCFCLQLPASAVFATVERYTLALQWMGWVVASNEETYNEVRKSDALLASATEYWAKPEVKAQYPRLCGRIIDSPVQMADGSLQLAGVFNHAVYGQKVDYVL